MRILFANIGWMIHYEGNTNIDTIQGGGSYDWKKKYETFLFQSINGINYGYVQPGGDSKTHTIRLERIDPKAKGKDFLSGVLVVWTACRPNAGGTVIVGWHENAKVYRTPQSGNNIGRHEYNIEADDKDCFLLPDILRTFSIARGVKGGMGRSNVWFADKPYHKKLRNNVITYVNSYKQLVGKINLSIKINRTSTIVNAIDVVTKRYKEYGYEVKSVRETENGWSMRVTHGKIKLNIDVREKNSEKRTLHITADEFSKMKAKNNQNYRMCVVTENADSILEVSTFLFDGQNWVCDEDKTKRMTVQREEITITHI